MKIETIGKSFVTLTRDPKDIGKQNAMVVFGVAQNHSRKNKEGDWQEDGTSFYDVVAYGELAEEVYEELKKGDSIGLTGKLRMTVWEDKDGDKRTTPQITLETYEKMAFKKSSREDGKSSQERGRSRKEGTDDNRNKEERPSENRRQSSNRNSAQKSRGGRRAPWQD